MGIQPRSVWTLVVYFTARPEYYKLSLDVNYKVQSSVKKNNNTKAIFPNVLLLHKIPENCKTIFDIFCPFIRVDIKAKRYQLRPLKIGDNPFFDITEKISWPVSTQVCYMSIQHLQKIVNIIQKVFIFIDLNEIVIVWRLFKKNLYFWKANFRIISPLPPFKSHEHFL